MTKNFECHYTNSFENIIDFDLHFNLDPVGATKPELIVHIFLDTENASINLGEVKISRDTNHIFSWHELEEEDIAFVRDIFDDQANTEKLSISMREHLQEKLPSCLSDVPSSNRLADFFEQNFVPPQEKMRPS